MNEDKWGAAPRRGVFLVMLMGAGLLFYGVFKSPLRVTPSADFQSIRMAVNYLDHGSLSAERVDIASPQPTRSVPPVYALMLAGLATLDAHLKSALACNAYREPVCNEPFKLQTIIYINVAVALFCIALAFIAAYLFSDSMQIALLAMIIVILFGKFSTFAKLIRPEIFFYFTVFAGYACAAWACRRASVIAAAGAGLFMGLAVLLNVYCIVAGLIMLVCIVPAARQMSPIHAASARGGQRAIGHAFALQHTFTLQHAFKLGLAFALGMAIPVTPWFWYSMTVFGDPMLAATQLAGQLAERIALTDMTWSEWAASYIYWLPGFGSDLAGLLLPPDAYQRLARDAPNALVRAGELALLPDAIQRTGDSASAFVLMLREVLASQPFWYLATTVPLFFYGLFSAAALAALLGVFLLRYFFKMAQVRQRLWTARLIVLPLLATALVQAFLTPNHMWCNLPVVFVFAYVISYKYGGL